MIARRAGALSREAGGTIALMLESDGPGGAEVFLLHLAEGLRNRGYGVVPVLPSWKTGWLAGQFEERGFEPLSFTLRRPIDLACLRQLKDDLRRTGVDLVHSHEFTMVVYGAAACRMLGLPHVVTMHGNQWVMDARRRRLALRWAFSSSEAVAAVSEDTRRDMLEKMSLPDEAMVTIPNGIPEPSGDPSGPVAEFGLTPDDVVLVSVGNLTERKGHIVLLRALQRLTAAGCTVPWRLIVAGEGDQRANLEAFVAEHGLGSRVSLPGHRSDIADLQAAAQVMVMPSLWEGLPLAVLEGMYAGNAVIGSRISGIPEAVREGVDGLLVPPGDDEALAAALRRVLEDAELRGRMGSSSRCRAHERFSIERMVNDYEALYLGSAT